MTNYIEPEDLKIGLLWYGKYEFNVNKAKKAFKRRFGFLPDTVYYYKENCNEDFGDLTAIEDSNRLKNEYLLCKTGKEEEEHKLGNDLQQMMLL